jgi:cytochrome c5
MSSSNMKDQDVKSNMSYMFAVMAIMAVAIYALANTIGAKPEAVTAKKTTTNVAERIAPVGKVSIAGAVMNAMIPAAHAAPNGKKVYGSGCGACHGAGVAGAPKLGDKADWKARIAAGNKTLYDHAIKGYQGKKGVMPPKGGFTNLSDAEVKAAVDYMVKSSK